MAAWTEAERANLRHYLGFSAIFLQADPRLENAITSVLAVADGGTRPDSATQVQIQGWLSDLATVDLRLKDLWIQAPASQVDEVKVNPAVGIALLRKEGRRMVNNIARALSTRPRADIYSSASPNPDGSTFGWVETGPFRW